MSDDTQPEALPDERRQVIEAFWADIDELVRLENERRLDGGDGQIQQKNLAAAISVPTSTVSDWFRKRTTVPDWPEIEKLVRELRGDPRAVRPRWREARSALQQRRPPTRAAAPTVVETGPSLASATAPSVSGEAPAPATAPPVSGEAPAPATGPSAPSEAPNGKALAPVHGGQQVTPRWPRKRIVTLAIVVVAGVTILVLAIVTTLVAVLPERRGQSASPEVWQATVVRTWSTSRKMDVGIRPYLDPSKVERAYPGYHTGDLVPVSCYYAEGRTVDDADTGERSSLWYRLNDERKLWLPGLFLQFGNRPGVHPPPGMPDCPDPI